ncbi:hypothetical protein GW17_00004738 [Ensete ventricosum]|nr:hypothetical protein GW17_00004738 [Ensete ventricosum]
MLVPSGTSRHTTRYINSPNRWYYPIASSWRTGQRADRYVLPGTSGDASSPRTGRGDASSPRAGRGDASFLTQDEATPRLTARDKATRDEVSPHSPTAFSVCLGIPSGTK